MTDTNDNRASEAEAEREAEINAEMERVGQDPDQVDAGSDDLGKQSAPTGTPAEEDQETESTEPTDEEEGEPEADQ